MDSWEKIDETLLPDKEVFYSKLNEEGISNIDYVHAQKIWQAFEIKNLGKYNDFMFNAIHYCLQMCLKSLEISVLKYMNLILLIFCQHQDEHGKLA